MLTQFTVAPSTTAYLHLYLDGTDKLDMLHDIQYTGAAGGTTIKRVRGYGSRDAAIPYPYSQAIPSVLDTTGTSLTSVKWATDSVTLTVPSIDANHRQAVEDLVFENRQKKQGQYLQYVYANTDASLPAVVTVYAVTS